MKKVIEIPEKNILIIIKSLYRTWYDVVESYRRPHYKMLNRSECKRLISMIYKNPMTIKEILIKFRYPQGTYKERQTRLTLAEFVVSGLVEASRRLNVQSGRPPCQYQSKVKA